MYPNEGNKDTKSELHVIPTLNLPARKRTADNKNHLLPSCRHISSKTILKKKFVMMIYLINLIAEKCLNREPEDYESTAKRKL